MKFKILIFLAITVFGLNEFSQAQTKVFSEAKGKPFVGRVYDFEKWNFLIGKQKYEIKNNGQGKRLVGNNRIKRFHFLLEKNEIIEHRIYFARYKNDLIVICETSIFDSGAGFITRLDGKTLKAKWRKDIPAFNVAKGLIEGNSAYLGGIGFAAKINLENGKYLWKHEDFYRKYREDGAFNVFEVPKIKGNVITYTENQNDYNRPPNIIKFNKNSGKVIEVKIN